MHPTHRERLSQVSAESGLDFITHLDDNVSQPSVSVNQPPQLQVHKPYNQNQNQAQTTPTPTTAPLDTTATIFDLDGIDPILLRYGPPQPGDLIDFHGPTGSGKTHFLYAIIISTILPKFWRHSKSCPSIPLLGKARSVIFLDLDQGFSIERLKDLLCLQIKDRVRRYLDTGRYDSDGNNHEPSSVQQQQRRQQQQQQGERESQEGQESASSTEQGQRIKNSTNTIGNDTPTTTTKEIDIQSPTFLAKIDQLALSCLRNLHIFRPQDTVSTIVILRTLDAYLFQQTTTSHPLSISTTSSQFQSHQQQQPSPPFTFLMLDSLSSFYWQDRAQTNHTRVMSLLYDALQRLGARWGLIFISTSWSLDTSSSSSSSSSSSAALANIADRAIPDSFRAKMRYRFLLQPRNLDRFESEHLLLREWQLRQQQQQQQQQQRLNGGRQYNLAQGGPQSQLEGVEVVAASAGAGNIQLSQGQDTKETRPSLFQGQMIIPEIQQETHTQSELFRFSISMNEGLFSFCPPPPPLPPQLPPSPPQNM